MSRYARRVDANHAEIAQALRAVGCAVLDIHSVGGALDLLAGRQGRLHLLEVKDGSKSASRRTLTPAELRTIAAFADVGVTVHIVVDVDSALAAVGAT